LQRTFRCAGNNESEEEDSSSVTHVTFVEAAAAWDKFKEARAGNLKTRWEAEKLYIKQGEEWVAHSVCAY